MPDVVAYYRYATKVRAEIAIGPEHKMSLNDEANQCFDDEIADAEYYASLESAIDMAAVDATSVTAKGIRAIKYMAQGHTTTEIASMIDAASCHHVTAWVSRARKYLKTHPELTNLLAPA